MGQNIGKAAQISSGTTTVDVVDRLADVSLVVDRTHKDSAEATVGEARQLEQQCGWVFHLAPQALPDGIESSSDTQHAKGWTSKRTATASRSSALAA